MTRLFARKLLSSVSPQFLAAVLSTRARANSHRLVREWGLGNINRKLLGSCGDSVLAGPFAGLTLAPMAWREHIGPFLFGTYEAELHSWLAEVLLSAPSQAIDVGAKFGYYAVGLAKHWRRTPVIAFDTDWWARKATREMAASNGTSNVTVKSYCSSKWLDQHLKPEAFVLTDCEGFEAQLLPGVRTPSIDSATMIVEVHDGIVAGASDALFRRFERTHSIQRVAAYAEAKACSDALRPSALSVGEFHQAVTEIRGQEEWLFLKPRRAGE